MLYMVTFTINTKYTSFMLAYMPAPWILWVVWVIRKCLGHPRMSSIVGRVHTLGFLCETDDISIQQRILFCSFFKSSMMFVVSCCFNPFIP